VAEVDICFANCVLSGIFNRHNLICHQDWKNSRIVTLHNVSIQSVANSALDPDGHVVGHLFEITSAG
jgi:hypothetical protein